MRGQLLARLSLAQAFTPGSANRIKNPEALNSNRCHLSQPQLQRLVTH